MNTIKEYESNSQCYNHVLNDLQDYMFTNEFIYKYSKKNMKPVKDFFSHKDKAQDINQNHNQSNNINKKNDDIFFSYEKDKLFWCFYVLKEGIETYEFIKSSSFKIEKEYKYKTAEQIKLFKDTFKSLKLKQNDLQDEFINKSCITLKGLIALCYIYNVNILYIKNRMYHEIITNDINKINIIVDNSKDCIINHNQTELNSNNKQNNIYIDFNSSKDIIEFYKNNYWKIENSNNPLKSINSYNLSELQNICSKLSIETKNNNKKLTKQELYEKILKFI